MASRIKIPKLTSHNVVVRLTDNQNEIELANELIFRNYVATGFWGENDRNRLETNKHLQTSARKVFLVWENERLVGTMSIIVDSQQGLPSDEVQPEPMQQLRIGRALLAEVSAFAMDQSQMSNRKLFFFLMSYVLQYSFYYAGIDRLVASCGWNHANFYESILCFSKITGPTYYPYTRDVGCLISLDLMEAHWLLSRRYPANPVTKESFYEFLLRDPQPCQRYPIDLQMKRARETNWIEHSLQKVA